MNQQKLEDQMLAEFGMKGLKLKRGALAFAYGMEALVLELKVVLI